MKNSLIAFLLLLCAHIAFMPLSLHAQQRVIISPFFSDFPVLADSLPKGWSASPYIQLSVHIDFPHNVTLNELKRYQFKNNLMYREIFRSFQNAIVQYGSLRKNNLTLNTWNSPAFNNEELQVIAKKNSCFSLSYNDCSSLAGTLTNKHDIPSFSYIHFKEWESLLPTNSERSDTTTLILNANPFLFYLITDKGEVDLYNTNSITILPHEECPTLCIFYKPLYDHKVLKYKNISITFISEKEALASQMHHKISLQTNDGAKSDSISLAAKTIPSDSVIFNALNALNHVVDLSTETRNKLTIAKTGLCYKAIRGTAESLDTMSVNFSFASDSIVVIDNGMFYNQSFLHELLHYFINNNPISIKGLPAQERHFLMESTVEYLAKYLYGKYIEHKDMFANSMGNKDVNTAMLRKQKHKIKVNKRITAGFKHDEMLNTADIYYGLLPNLLHQLATSAHVDEDLFATAVCNYVKKRDANLFSLKDFFSYLKKQGFNFTDKQKKNIRFLLQNE